MRRGKEDEEEEEEEGEEMEEEGKEEEWEVSSCSRRLTGMMRGAGGGARTR